MLHCTINMLRCTNFVLQICRWPTAAFIQFRSSADTSSALNRSEQTMTEPFTFSNINPFSNAFADLLKGAPFANPPSDVQRTVQEGLATSQAATLKSLSSAKDGVVAIEQAGNAVRLDGGKLASKVFEHVIHNSEAAFSAAQVVANAKSPSEAVQLHAQFVQSQFAKAGEQAKELFELSIGVAQRSAEALTGLVQFATVAK